MTAKILKGTLVRIKSQFCESHVSAWYRLSEDERDECRAARRERLDAAEALSTALVSLGWLRVTATLNSTKTPSTA